MDFSEAVLRAKNGESCSTLAQALLDQLSDSERLHLLDGDTPFWPGLKSMIMDGYNNTPIIAGEVKRLSIPGLRFADGPRGIVLGQSTCFPVSMARGATWDVALEQRVGEAIGLEGRAQDANFFGGICINLPRHPAWGRSQETYGEDPIALGEFGAALSRGVQKNMMAVVKHFALNSMENSRFKVNVTCDEAVLQEVYLPHFKRVVEAGKVMGVMSSYNSVNGEWAGQNQALLTDILRSKWKFSGITVSDFLFGLRDPVLSLKAGLDVEEPFLQQRAVKLPRALRRGDIDQALIDKAALRILATQIRFYGQRIESEPNRDVIFSPAHRDLAREVAARSIVLLRNEAPTGCSEPLLPLKPRQGLTVAVIGRLADKNNTGDHGSSDVRSPEVISPYRGIQKLVENTGGKVILEATSSSKRAISVAQNADVAVLIVGNDASDEGEYIASGTRSVLPVPSLKEVFTSFIPLVFHLVTKGLTFDTPDDQAPGVGGDRSSLSLRSEEIEMIKAVADVNSQTIVVVVSGGTVILEPWISRVPATIYGWYSGSQGGIALAEVLFGVSDASGRLPFTQPRSEADLPKFEANTNQCTYDRWFGQRYLDHTKISAHFPLGFGLSYTEFAIFNASISEIRSHESDEHFLINLEVANTGKRSGRHVVQVYGRPCTISADFPSRVLMGFASLEVAASQTIGVKVLAYTQPLKRWDQDKFVAVSRRNIVEISRFSGDPKSINLDVLL